MAQNNTNLLSYFRSLTQVPLSWQWCWQNCAPSWRSWRRTCFLASFSLPCSLAWALLPPLKPATSSFPLCLYHIPSQMWTFFYLHLILLKTAPPESFKMISPFLGQLMSNLNSVCNTNSPLPHTITYSQVLDIRRQTCWGVGGGHYSACHTLLQLNQKKTRKRGHFLSIKH